MHNGTVCAVTGNGAEGKTAKVGVFCAKRGEALLDREFRFFADLAFSMISSSVLRKRTMATPSNCMARRKPAISRSSLMARKVGTGVTREVQTEYKPNWWKISTACWFMLSAYPDDGLFRIERMKEIGCTFVGMEPDIVRFQFFSHDFIDGASR